MGVTTLPGLALRAHRRPDIHATELPGLDRQICAATYGDPPDPPAISAVLAALSEATTPTASSTDSVTTTSTTTAPSTKARDPAGRPTRDIA